MEPAAAGETVSLEQKRPAGGPPGAPAPAQTRREGSRSSPLVLGLLIALAIVLALWLVQVRRSSALGARVETLESELATAQERIDAYDRHLEEVRTRVGSLSGQLGDLQALLEAGPQARVPEDVGPATDDVAPAPGE